MALGIWQSLVLVDSNGDNPVRTVRLSFLPAFSSPPSIGNSQTGAVAPRA
jgi:hypothetical protein